MKKALFFSGFVFAVFAAGSSLMHFTHANGGGSIGGFASAPGDVNCTECHTGTAIINSPKTSFTSNIPSGGYVPGQTYSCTLSVNNSTNKHGFEMKSYAFGSIDAGVFTANTDVQVLQSGKRVTHKSSSTSGNGGKSWIFNWTAPSPGVDTLCFFYSVNATNGDFSTTGDVVYTGVECVEKGLGVGIEESVLASFKVFPNPLPLGQNLTLESPYETPSIIEVFDVKGSKVWSNQLFIQKGSNVIPSSTLSKGIYILKVSSELENFEQKIMVY